MKDTFDYDAAKRNLTEKEKKLKSDDEQRRQLMLSKVIEELKKCFSESDVEIYLVGSIIQPYHFSARSDIDIVLKQFEGDRFATWSKLERAIDHKIELIIYERCHFKEYIDKHGLKVK